MNAAVLLSATEPDDVARAVLDRLGGVGTVAVAPAVNPMAGTGSMMGSSDFDAAVLVEVEGADALVAALDDERIDRDRSTAAVGELHQLRPGPSSWAGSLVVLVAVHPVAGASLESFRSGWLEVGRVNAAGHPTCSAYGQLHADVEATAAVVAGARLGAGPYEGVAVEVFPDLAALHEGHRWAASPASVGAPEGSDDELMAHLGRHLDFAGAGTLLALAH